MADFCWDCLADEIYPEHPEKNDLRGLCADDETVVVLCEGHGWIEVDHRGKRVPPDLPPAPEGDCPTCDGIATHVGDCTTERHGEGLS